MVQGYSIEDVQKFYKDNFGAARTHIYVAGKFDPAAMRKAITDAFSSWPHGPDPFIDIPKPVTKHDLAVIDRPGAVQSTLYIGLPTIDPSNSDYIPLQVMNAILGGSFGSRITSNIREQKGYTYSPFSQLSSRYRDAYWVQVADVTAQYTGASIKEILYEIDRLQKDPPTSQELEGIKNYLAKNLRSLSATSAGDGAKIHQRAEVDDGGCRRQAEDRRPAHELSDDWRELKGAVSSEPSALSHNRLGALLFRMTTLST
jgi:predicted Zn-dependent peptidase